MESQRHKTYKRAVSYDSKEAERSDPLRSILEEGAKDAYSRQWHRIERGLRLNRLRLFVEEISPNYGMTKDEKEQLFVFLKKALDKKLLNTLKVVQYDTSTQRILSIKGLDMKRNEETGQLHYELNAKKTKDVGTRKRRKDEIPSVSVSLPPTS